MTFSYCRTWDSVISTVTPLVWSWCDFGQGKEFFVSSELCSPVLGLQHFPIQREAGGSFPGDSAYTTSDIIWTTRTNTHIGRSLDGGQYSAQRYSDLSRVGAPHKSVHCTAVIITNFLFTSIVKPTRCTSVIKFILFWNDTLNVSDGLSVHHHEFKIVHTATKQILLAAC